MAKEFDAIAGQYDQTFTHTLTGEFLRRHVHALVLPFLLQKPGKALELNAGTGEDALWLAKLGWDVLATDIAQEMLQVACHKKVSAGIPPDASPHFQALALENLHNLEATDFDLIFSNFGGLNCVPPEILQQLSPNIAQKLKPGGLCIVVVMGRFCWWESLYFLIKGKHSDVFRRAQTGPVSARLDTNTSVNTWYYSPKMIREILGKNGLEVQACRPVGFWLPPSYLDPLFAKRPWILNALQFLEKHLAPAWLAPTADHFLIYLKKRDESC